MAEAEARDLPTRQRAADQAAADMPAPRHSRRPLPARTAAPEPHTKTREARRSSTRRPLGTEAAEAALAALELLARRATPVMVAAVALGSTVLLTQAAVAAQAEGRRSTAVQAEAAVAVPVALALPELRAKRTQDLAEAVEWQAQAAVQAAPES
jgi:hypothetical protein